MGSGQRTSPSDLECLLRTKPAKRGSGQRISPSDLEFSYFGETVQERSGQRTSPSDLESNRANPLKLQEYS